MRFLPSSYYKPLLPDGRQAPIDWELYCLLGSNGWPLAISVSNKRRIVDILLTLFQFFSELVLACGELNFAYENIGNISTFCSSFAPFLILLEVMLRAYNIIYKRTGLRAQLQNFYKKIYIERSLNPEIFEQIRYQQLPTKYATITYIITLMTYFYIPIYGLIHHQRLLPFPMSYRYDYKTSCLVYVILLGIALWSGIAVVGPMVAEANMLAMQILHLNARYTLLLRDLRKVAQIAIEGCDKQNEEVENASVTGRFRHGLINVIRRNVELNKFAASLQEQYSFRIFVMMAFSATLLCVLGFLTATLGLSMENIKFATWIVGKVIELLIFGRLGTLLSTTTNEISTTYYFCGWEDVILESSDATENAKIMKLVALAIHLNINPFQLSGLKFFNVNYKAVMSILKGAASYFTVIYAYR